MQYKLEEIESADYSELIKMEIVYGVKCFIYKVKDYSSWRNKEFYEVHMYVIEGGVLKFYFKKKVFTYVEAIDMLSRLKDEDLHFAQKEE